LSTPDHIFDARQQSSFTELSWNKKTLHSDWVIGTNLITENIAEKPFVINQDKIDYRYNTTGLFIQNAWSMNEKVVIETGLRGDHVNEFGFELLPRIATMFKISPNFTTRIGGGFGYKTPTIFTEEAERRQFRNILPIDVRRVWKRILDLPIKISNYLLGIRIQMLTLILKTQSKFYPLLRAIASIMY
jgi:iron complex outermembrane receptor protein